MDNHMQTIEKQLSQIPSISAADEDVVKCFQMVPKAFFKENYDLTNPAVFQSVILDKAYGTHDTLSSYLDRVEMSLLTQISSRSDKFFEACSTQDELSQQVSVACTQVDTLRKRMSTFQMENVQKMLAVAQCSRRKKRYDLIHEKVRLIRETRHAEESIQALLHTQDFMGAMELIQQTLELLDTKLQKLDCMSALREKLVEYNELIAKQLTQKFISIVISADTDLETQVLPSFQALLTLDCMTRVLGAYKSRLVQDIKVVLKTVVAETIGGHSTNEEAKVTAQLRGLNSDEFLSCLVMIFEHLVLVLQRVANVDQLIQKHTKDTEILKESDEVVRKACEFSQRSISNLFSVRKDVQATHSMEQLQVMYDTTMEFVVKLEDITSKTDYTLRGALFSQLKLFFDKYHHAYLAKFISTLDHELWKNAEVSSTRQAAIDEFVALESSSPRSSSGKPSRSVEIQGRSYRVVWSALFLCEILLHYIDCVNRFPILSTDGVQKCAEILRLFNSRTTQLVLGAGAMQVARLKSISARHLALTYESLEFIHVCVPYLSKRLLEHLPPRQHVLLSELERIEADYAQHCVKIEAKLISIVQDQIMKKALNETTMIDYDQDDLSIPTRPLNDIVTNITKLHAVLSPILQPSELKKLFQSMYDMFTSEFPVHFMNITPETTKGKENVISDMNWFILKIKQLQGVEIESTALADHFKQTYKSS